MQIDFQPETTKLQKGDLQGPLSGPSIMQKARKNSKNKIEKLSSHLLVNKK